MKENRVIHKKKIWKVFLEMILKGEKDWEFRNNFFPNPGELIMFSEVIPKTNSEIIPDHGKSIITGRILLVKVKKILFYDKNNCMFEFDIITLLQE